MSECEFERDTALSKRKLSSYVFHKEKETLQKLNCLTNAYSVTTHTQGCSVNCLHLKSDESQKSWEADGICTQDSPLSDSKPINFDEFIAKIQIKYEKQGMLCDEELQMIRRVSSAFSIFERNETGKSIQSEKAKMLNNHLQRHFQLFENAKRSLVSMEVKKEYELKKISEFFKETR
jgi:hypothetical protein